MISVSMSHCTGATIKVDEMMGSFESFCGGDESYSLDSASALPFLDPGLYVTLKESVRRIGTSEPGVD